MSSSAAAAVSPEYIFERSDENSSSSLLGVQLLSALLLFILTFTVGVAPVIFLRIWSQRESTRLDGRSKKSSLALQVLLFFGGGVLLSISFVHLIPEIQESWEDYEAKHHHNDSQSSQGNSSAEASHKHHNVPIIELAICGGFFLIYFIEEFMFALIGRDHHQHHHHHGSGHNSDPIESMIGQTDCDCTRLSDPKVPNQQESKYGSVNSPPPMMTSVVVNQNVSHRDADADKNVTTTSNALNSNVTDNNHTDNNTFRKTSGRDMIDSSKKYQKMTWPMFFHGLITILGFSVHSIFDGVVIGIQKTSSSLWTVFFAIFLHKTVVAMAVCMDLYEKSQNLKMTFIHMSIFSIMSPIGVSMIVFSQGYISDEKSLFMILLSAVSTGTIIYIVFFEILQRERISSLSGIGQFFVVLIGFTVMTLITTFVGDE
ncbi:zinc transporter ZIP2-like [Brevipalpus obovatus]|uniref:zinc transporter ZIP2-like n=1 Tax=Brevipalpus obovatus TaxID=246614 RepID=UPI003D9ED464